MPVIIEGGDDTPSPVRYETPSLVEEVLMALAGNTIDMGQITWLTQPVSETDISLPVDSGVQLFRGIAEVGDELIYIASVDEGTLNLSPNGRGYRGTTPQAWAENTEILFGPRFPRVQVLREINDVLSNVFPMLWGVAETEFTVSGIQRLYPLPAGAEDVKLVEWRPITPTEAWEPISRYRFYDNAPSNIDTGKAIELPSVQTGRTVRVRYSIRPERLTAGSTFTDSHLNDSAWPAVKYGALHRLASAPTLGTLERDSAQAGEYDRVGRGRPLGTDVAQYYYALYQQYLADERKRLLADNYQRVTYRR